MGLSSKVLHKLAYLYKYWITCGGDKVSYLRTLGASIGNNCDIITNVTNFGSEPWLIQVGDKVTLAYGSWLITHDGSSRLFRDRFTSMSKFGNKFGAIVIGDNCFIGINAIILPGVVIGNNSIVGSGSVITRSVAPNSVVAGNPAKYICSLDDYVERYEGKMLTIHSTDRISLRKELTTHFWGSSR